ncbi:MAG: F0F1 ATP synthase subunit B [Candidatus Kerfeldbacteria bacterium]
MNELFSKLGIDWKLLIAQVINFAILFWVLKRFAYKPILSMLERRRATVEKSLVDAKKIEERLGALEQERETVLGNARAEAHTIVESATKDAATFTEQSKQQTKAETAAMIEAARKDVTRMKDTIVADAKEDIANLVVAGAEKVIRIKLNPDTEQELIHDTLRRVKGPR